MPKIIRLTENDLTRIVNRVIKEQLMSGSSNKAVEAQLQACGRSAAQPTQKTNKLADQIYNSITGAGTDENRIYDAFKKLSSKEELCALAKSYLTTYGTTLFSDLDGDIDDEGEWRIISTIMRNLPAAQQGGAAVPANQRQLTINKTFCSVKNGVIVSQSSDRNGERWDAYVANFKVTPQEIETAKKSCPQPSATTVNPQQKVGTPSAKPSNLQQAGPSNQGKPSGSVAQY